MVNKFLELIKLRRTHYVLKKESSLNNDEIVEIVKEAVLHTPTAFNSQSGRVVVLFGNEHNTLWNIVIQELRKVVPSDSFQPTLDKVNMFKNSYGTILYFEDQDVVRGLQNQFPLYKDNFPIWSNESSGILYFVVWTALAENGIGASIQHYNPLIDNEVAKQYNIPSNWKLTGQMPFGLPGGPLDKKEFLPIEQRLKVFGE